MSEDFFERIKRGLNGKTEDEADWEHLKQSATGTKLPAITLNGNGHRSLLVAPEVEPRARDRRSKREAAEEQRQLDRITSAARRYGLVQDATRAVVLHGLDSIDQAQDDMMAILHGRNRLQEMNSLMAEVIAQSLQQLCAYTQSISELHAKRQMENL